MVFKRNANLFVDWKMEPNKVRWHIGPWLKNAGYLFVLILQLIPPGHARTGNIEKILEPRLIELNQRFKAGILHEVGNPGLWFETLVDDLMNWQDTAHNMAGNYWYSLTPERQVELTNALKQSMERRFLALLEQLGPHPRIYLEQSNPIHGSNTNVLSIRIEDKNQRSAAKLTFETRNDDRMILVNLFTESTDIVREYSKQIQKTMDDYNFKVLIADLTDRNEIILEDFEDQKVGKFPSGWEWMPRDDNTKKLYFTREEGGNHYLNAKDRGGSVIIGKRFRWNVCRFPFVSWRWRVHALPPNSDERYTPKNDSAAGVYVTFLRNFLGIPKSLKYVWSTTLPRGSATRRSGIGRPWVIVIQTGKQGIGKWHTEIVNAFEDYRQLFGKEPPCQAQAIGVLTDANSTQSYAEADYDDFKVFRHAQAGSGIRQVLPAGD